MRDKNLIKRHRIAAQQEMLARGEKTPPMEAHGVIADIRKRDERRRKAEERAAAIRSSPKVTSDDGASS